MFVFFYAFQGSVAIAGAAVNWLRDNLEIIKDTQDLGFYVTDLIGKF